MIAFHSYEIPTDVFFLITKYLEVQDVLAGEFKGKVIQQNQNPKFE